MESEVLEFTTQWGYNISQLDIFVNMYAFISGKVTQFELQDIK